VAVEEPSAAVASAVVAREGSPRAAAVMVTAVMDTAVAMDTVVGAGAAGVGAVGVLASVIGQGITDTDTILTLMGMVIRLILTHTTPRTTAIQLHTEIRTDIRRHMGIRLLTRHTDTIRTPTFIPVQGLA